MTVVVGRVVETAGEATVGGMEVEVMGAEVKGVVETGVEAMAAMMEVVEMEAV